MRGVSESNSVLLIRLPGACIPRLDHGFCIPRAICLLDRVRQRLHQEGTHQAKYESRLTLFLSAGKRRRTYYACILRWSLLQRNLHRVCYPLLGPYLSFHPHTLRSDSPALSIIALKQLRYGLNDGNGSPNCNAATVSCGFYNTPGYNVAVSQNLFGASSGQTSTCGTCWQLYPVSDPNAADTTARVAGLNSIVVKVNNLCPASGNEKDVSHPILCPLVEERIC